MNDGEQDIAFLPACLVVIVIVLMAIVFAGAARAQDAATRSGMVAPDSSITLTHIQLPQIPSIQEVPLSSDVPGAGLRYAMLKDILVVVQEDKKKAQIAHDRWINSINHPDIIHPKVDFGSRGQSDWKVVLEDIRSINDRFYPGEPIDFTHPDIDPNQPRDSDPAGVDDKTLKEGRRLHGWGQSAMGTINNLITKMTAEMVAIKAADPKNPQFGQQ